MFDVGFWELSLLGVLALVILGPERLPVVARTLGSWVRRARHFVSNFGEELTGDSSVADLRDEVRRMRNEIEGHTRETLNDVDGMSNDDDTNTSEQDSDQPHSMYGTDDVDNTPGSNKAHDNDETEADERVEVDGMADDLEEPTSSAPDSSVDALATAGEPVDVPPDGDDEEALYARVRRRYAGVDATQDMAPDTADDDAGSARAPTSNAE